MPLFLLFFFFPPLLNVKHIHALPISLLLRLLFFLFLKPCSPCLFRSSSCSFFFCCCSSYSASSLSSLVSSSCSSCSSSSLSLFRSLARPFQFPRSVSFSFFVLFFYRLNPLLVFFLLLFLCYFSLSFYLLTCYNRCTTIS